MIKLEQRKYSKKREAILTMIRSTDTHPGASWVYERLKPSIPDLSLGTVYRNIKVFLREGSLAFVGVINGEERFDGVVRPHPHFVCDLCGALLDLPCPSGEAQKILAENYNPVPAGEKDGGRFIIDYRKTLFSGLCAACAANRREPSLA